MADELFDELLRTANNSKGDAYAHLFVSGEQQVEFIHEDGIKKLWAKRSDKAYKKYLEGRLMKLQAKRNNLKSQRDVQRNDEEQAKVREELNRRG